MRTITAICCVALLIGTASAAPHEARVPLRDGKLRLGELSAELLGALHLNHIKLPDAAIDFRGLRGSLMVAAMNESLGDGCRLTVEDDALVLHVDPAKLPHDVDQSK